MQEGDVIAGRFLLQALAGAGGMSTVFRAKDFRTGKTVAVKSLHAEGAPVDRFEREAAVLSELSHPAIVEYIAHGGADIGEPFLAMEWLQGEDLEVRIARGRLKAQEAVTVGRAAASALAAAHARGIVHRDVKPSNIFLPGGIIAAAKVLDFGIARLLQSGATRMTHAGMILGTPGYMSPEQARGDSEVDARSDLFSLGVVLYESLTGACPFEAEHLMGTLAKVLLAEPPRLREIGVDVPSALDELIAQMMAKDPKDRPQLAADVMRALDALDDAAPTVRSPPVAVQSWLTHGEQRLLSVLFVGAPPVGTDPAQARAALERVVTAHGGGVEMFADGSAVVLLAVAGAATDQAARAAEHGLAVRAALPFATVVLATGPGIVSPRDPKATRPDMSANNCPPIIGEVIDRAVARMRHEIEGGATPSEAVAVDEVTAGLLDARFEIGGDAGGLYVSRRHDAGSPMRTLLGVATPFVGRDREMEALAHMLDECARMRQARAALVTGAPGVGKSRLGAELARLAPERGFDVWVARGDLVKTHGPFALLSRAIEGLAQIFGDEPLSVRRRKLLARIGRHLPRERAEQVACFLGEVSGTPFPDQGNSELQLARINPVLLVDFVRRAFEAWIAAECEDRPVLVIVEDLQWCDGPSARLLDDALRNLARRPFAVVGLARPDLAPDLARIFQGRNAREIRLGELQPAAGRALASAVLGDAAESSLLDAIVERSGGNAFYLEELLRSVRGGKGIASLPETVIAMIHARFDAVSPAARRMLRAASVFGDVFSRRGIAALLGSADDDDVGKCLAELVLNDLLVPIEAGRLTGRAEFAFRSGLVREAAYAMLVDEDRERGHRRAAEYLEASGEPQAVVIAEHFERGRRPERARGPYAAAARQALAGNDFRGAMDRARRAAECGATGHTLGEVLLTYADAAMWLGEVADGAAQASAALARFERSSAVWFQAATLAAMAESRLGHLDTFRAIVRDIVSAIGEGPPSAADVEIFAAQVGALSRTAVSSFHCGEVGLGAVLLGRLRACLSSGRLDRHPFLLGSTYRALSISSHSQGDLMTAFSMSRKSAACFERAGALRDAAANSANAGFFLTELGKNADAEKMLLGALATAEQLGLPNVAANARQNLSTVLSRRGAYTEAIKMAQSALLAFESQGAPRMITLGRIYLARVLLSAKRPDDAEPYARSAAEVARHAPRFRAYALAALSVVLLAQGRLKEARASAEEAMAELDANGVEEGEMFVRLADLEARLASDDTFTALDEVRAKLLRRADMIRDPAFRETFLAGVPEHARILALADER